MSKRSWLLFRLRAGLLVFLFGSGLHITAQEQVLALWADGVPGQGTPRDSETVRVTPEGDHVVTNIHEPSITAYLPPTENATGVAVMVMPGGGHKELWMDHEGYSVASWLKDHGIAAFVLKYRLALQQGSTYTVEGTELQDAQRAVRLIRVNAKKWHIDPHQIGVMGFSAGGELGALVSLRNDAGRPNSPDPVERQSSRPDFQALIYPGIPPNMSLPFTADTPPAFLACGANDRPDISRRLPELYTSLKQLDVPVELHIFAGVGHGFGMRGTNTGAVRLWPDLFLEWLSSVGLASSSNR